MFSREIFADRLKQLRANAGLSCASLGNEVGVTSASITQLEKGQRSPSVELLTSLAEFFNVSTDYLIGRDRTEPTQEEAMLHTQLIGLSTKDQREVIRYSKYIKLHPLDDF